MPHGLTRQGPCPHPRNLNVLHATLCCHAVAQEHATYLQPHVHCQSLTHNLPPPPPPCTPSPAAYFTAVVLWDFVPLRVLPPALFSLISYWMIGLRATPSAWAANWLVLVLANIAAAALNMSIGAAAGSVSLANSVGSLGVLASTLFGGLLLSRSRMPRAVAWLADLSYVRCVYGVPGRFGSTAGRLSMSCDARGRVRDRSVRGVMAAMHRPRTPVP